MKRYCFIILLIAIAVSCKEDGPDPVYYSKPEVTTTPVSNITPFTAQTGGTIVSTGGAPITERGVCYSMLPSPTIDDSTTVSSEATEQFTVTITGLKQNTTFYVRAFAINTTGIGYGEQFSFTTEKSALPEVYTSGITEITQNTAQSGGKVTDDGGEPVTGRGICWSTSHSPDITGSHTNDGADTGIYVSTISGLEKRTAYYVRAYATNKYGTSYGKEISFTTSDTATGQPCEGIPTVVYEGKTYNTVQIGNKCWFKENLNVGTRIPGNDDMIPGNYKIEKYCYNDEEIFCDQYGGLYQWDEAMQNVFVEGSRGICPLGWHIPSYSDWTDLVAPFGGTMEAGRALKYNTTWYDDGNGTNLSGFTGLPGGKGYLGQFSETGKNSYMWLSYLYDPEKAWYMILRSAGDNADLNYDLRRLAFSVRCVKDHYPKD